MDPVVYVLTVPSNRFAVLVWLTTITEFPVIYARPVETVNDTDPLLGVIVADVEAVRNLSPGRPVAPVAPVAPVGPVDPWAPVGPSIPSRFTLYVAAAVKVP